jgi:AcrR family transcriptional regulator
VSPRGKAIHGVNEQLFAAAERVLARSGPSGLTSRAITDEAGCAKGVLHNHFGDLDGFLAAYVLDRSAHLADKARTLVHQAGTGTVLDNLTDATVALFGPPALAISSLVISRAEVAQRLSHGRAAEPVLHEIQAAFTKYLDAERGLGRIAPGADTSTISFTVFASAHQLFLSDTQRPIARDRIRQILLSLLTGVTTGE